MAEPTTASSPPPRPLKIIAGADSFGCTLKDTLVSHLRSLNIDVEDLGTSSYYSIAAEVGRRVSSSDSLTNPSPEVRGLVACGTGVGVSIFANKFPGVSAATCLSVDEAKNTRSINNSNVLAVSGMSTSPDAAIQILDTWLNTPFKSPCPASGSNPWSEELASFLDNSLAEMSKIGLEQKPSVEKPEKEHKKEEKSNIAPCALCSLARSREFEIIEMIPGGEMKIVRESPTSAIVRFKAGSVEPAHHHSFGHDLMVLKGSKRVWNLSKKAKYDLGVGDYLFTPAGDVHRVKYFEDTEFFLKWEGGWDIMFDEELDFAKREIEKEGEDGFELVK